MDEYTLEDLERIEKIDQFIEFIRPFYPNIEIPKITIEDFEKALIKTYIKLIGKIIMYSPENMRTFLRSYLLKYEIMNLKQIILGSIVGLSREEKEKNIYFIVEEYLDNKDFITELLNISSLDEIQLFLRNTKYNKIIREGILYFKNTNETFVLESFLDQLYYRNLNTHLKYFDRKEKEMISLFISYKTEIYNVNIVYRGIITGVDKKLLRQFFVGNYLFLDEGKLEALLQSNNTNEFIERINAFLTSVGEVSSYFTPFSKETMHFRENIERLYQKYYFKQFKIRIDDIEYTTIYKILELVIRKYKEIWYYIIPQMVDIVHRKFEMLKSDK